MNEMAAKAKSHLAGMGSRRIGARGALAFATTVLAASTLATTRPAQCDFFYDGSVIHRGYVFDPQTLEQVRPGSAAEQVLILMGTPSTTSTVGGDAWYYISQKVERALPFLPARITDQRVYAVYFDKSKKVTRTANYGLEDGRVVDISSHVTVTGGGESRLLQTLIKQVGNFRMGF
jgi:outer membrane protein assembly factor BamE (lipoprotein component of BamABCDE complex)